MTSDKILILDASTFGPQVQKSGGVPLLVDFWAAWCAPCRMMAPVLDKIADLFDGRLQVAKVDVDGNPDLAAQYGIFSIPTLLLFKNGEVVESLVGAQSEQQLAEVLSRHTG